MERSPCMCYVPCRLAVYHVRQGLPGRAMGAYFSASAQRYFSSSYFVIRGLHLLDGQVLGSRLDFDGGVNGAAIVGLRFPPASVLSLFWSVLGEGGDISSSFTSLTTRNTYI